MNWIIKPFDQLNTTELYEILKTRCEVFVVEQNCPYPDMDDIDYHAFHLFAMENNRVAAYCRIIPKGLKYQEASIGRVVTAAAYRKKGLGKELLKNAIHYSTIQLCETEIRISGQAYLQQFYESFGFKTVSNVYPEDGIPHYEMLFQKNK